MDTYIPASFKPSDDPDVVYNKLDAVAYKLAVAAEVYESAKREREDAICAARAWGMTYLNLQKVFGISQKTIRQIVDMRIPPNYPESSHGN